LQADFTRPGREQVGSVIHVDDAGTKANVERLKLVVLHGDKIGEVIVIRGETTVGRNPNEPHAVSVSHPSVSRTHARLWRGDNGWYVEDCKSTNGTHVNGARIVGACALHHGDIIAFGSVVVETCCPTRSLARGDARNAVNRDPLTGLFTKQYANAHLEAEVCESYRRGRPVSIIYTDIDDMGALNDDFGRSAGDGILRQAARLFEERTRRSDVMARVQGEEFVLILSGVPLSICVRVGRRLLTALRDHRISPALPPGGVTASMGAASTQGRWLSSQDLLEEAQQATQLARSKGGDRLRVLSSSAANQAA